MSIDEMSMINNGNFAKNDQINTNNLLNTTVMVE